MRKFILKLRPWSPSAFLAALLTIALAAALQEIFLLFGIALHFAAFLPAILIASLVAGVPAGVFAAFLTLPIVWWAFLPPHFEFNPLTAADYNRFAVFGVASLLAIGVSDLYRKGISLMSK